MKAPASGIQVGRLFETGEAPPLELTLYYGGRQVCAPGHSHYGVRDHFLLHYIFSGHGIFQHEDRTETLGRGDGFVLFPNRPGLYRADARQPWTYGWAGFSGAQAATHLAQVGISRRTPVFHLKPGGPGEKCCRELMAWPDGGRNRRAGPRREFHFRSLLYRLLHCLLEEAPPAVEKSETDYVHYALRFIHRNHSRPITIEEVARHVGIDRKYLSLLFRKETGMSPKTYLTQTRLSTAAGLLRGTDLPIFAVAHSVGYPDEMHFSKAFHALQGATPTRYRRQGPGKHEPRWIR